MLMHSWTNTAIQYETEMATKQELEQAFKHFYDKGEKEKARQIFQAIQSGQYDGSAQPAQDGQQEQPGMSLQQRIISKVLEPAATLGTGALAEPAAGIAGAIGLARGGLAEGADAVESTREALTYMPRTSGGRESLQAIAETLEPVIGPLQEAETKLGDLGYDLAGPVGGTVGQVLPTALLEVVGYGVGKKLKDAGRVASKATSGEPEPGAANIVAQGERFDVPVMTTDVKPPDTYFGKLMQGFSEKLGPLGSGSARASQQQAREAALRAYADEFEIELDSPFAEQMVRSMNSKAAKTMERLGAVRKRAIDALNPYGDVPMERTRAAIEGLIKEESSLGAKADQSIIKQLNDTLEELDGRDFSGVRDLRTKVIKEKRAAARSPDDAPAGILQKVKSAMDKDMMDFARANDRDAAADWIRSNRGFAEAYTTNRDTELRRIFNTGEATPENVIPILRRGKPSELKRLKNSLTPKGQESARRAILQDALKDSKFFDLDTEANPNSFVTAMNRPNRQQAVKVFFDGKQREQLDGLNRLLNATRRAQEGQALVKTGEQNVVTALAALGGLGAGYYGGPVGITGIAAASALAKAYESGPVRNALIRLANTKPGTPAETKSLELAASAVAAGLKAAIEEQQQKEPKPQ